MFHFYVSMNATTSTIFCVENHPFSCHNLFARIAKQWLKKEKQMLFALVMTVNLFKLNENCVKKKQKLNEIISLGF